MQMVARKTIKIIRKAYLEKLIATIVNDANVNGFLREVYHPFQEFDVPNFVLDLFSFSHLSHVIGSSNIWMYIAQINKHFFLSTKPNTTLEKLPMISIPHVKAKHKLRWLRWWNPSPIATSFLWFHWEKLWEMNLEIVLWGHPFGLDKYYIFLMLPTNMFSIVYLWTSN